jgi:outer membrane receptor protein involved in Fe transport
MPSDNYIKPQIADQVAIGYFNNFKEDAYTIEVESFYKTIKNRMDYIDGADLIANEAIEQVILNGEMRSYGLEFMLRKNTGNLSGWIAYTLSKSQQKTPGRTADEIGINNGEWYRSAYDKTHNLAVTGSYKLNEKWNFGANFTLQTGQPVTYPNGQYTYQGITVPSYGIRNENSLPTYHHLDVSATLTPKSSQTKKWKGEWVFSVYNIYGRKNAASISFRENAETGNNEAVRLSIFGIVPSVSYNFKF